MEQVIVSVRANASASQVRRSVAAQGQLIFVVGRQNSPKIISKY